MMDRIAAGASPESYRNDFFERVYAPWLARHPEHSEAAAVLIRAVAEAADTRARLAARYQCDMPETLVMSLTSVCNRRCQFCGASDVVAGPKLRLSRELFDRALDECRVLGIRRIALVGGEPSLLLDLEARLEANPDFFFSVYTNGLLLDDARLQRLAGLANHILIVNVSATNQAGRATGIEPEALEVLERLSQRGVLFGYAATIHRNNRELFSRRQTLERIHRFEPWLGVSFDYLPATESDDALTVDAAEREQVIRVAREAASSRGMMLVCIPEDEDTMGGCGAAGRSFVHLAPDGFITPCPFVSHAAHRFPEQSLLEAVRGEYFSELRRRSRGWEKLDGPCGYRSAAHELDEISGRHGASPYTERTATRTGGPGRARLKVLRIA